MPHHPTLCSSICVPAVVFQHSCSSSRVPAFMFQQSCFSIYVSASVIQHLCFSTYVSLLCCSICVRICVAASVFTSNSRVSASMFQHVFTFVLQHLCSHLCCSLCVRFQQSCQCFSICFHFCVSASVFHICVAASMFSCFTFVLQPLCSLPTVCVSTSTFQHDSVFVFQLSMFLYLCSNTCACSITNRLSSMTTLTICVSFCVPAFVFYKQSIAINDNLDHLHHLCCSHISNNSLMLYQFDIYLFYIVGIHFLMHIIHNILYVHWDMHQ
jgi:hypothetical protein